MRWLARSGLLAVAALLLLACGLMGDDPRPGADDSSNDGTGAGGGSPSASLVQTAYLKASNTRKQSSFGWAVALSQDGSTLAVGALQEDNGLSGDGPGPVSSLSGAVYIFTRQGSTWTQQALLRPSDTAPGDQFGYAVSLSADGDTLAVGAATESSASASDPLDDSAPEAGAVYVFERNDGEWSERAYLKASHPGADDFFGYALALSADGTRLAISAWGEGSGSPGVDADPTDDSMPRAGAVYVFELADGSWSERAYLKAGQPRASAFFGSALALAADANTLVVGASNESRSADGSDGDLSQDISAGAGAIYVFTRIGETWQQRARLEATNASSHSYFGSEVALSADATTIAVGAPNGGPLDDGAKGYAGAVYVFEGEGASWQERGYLLASNAEHSDQFGTFVGLSGSGDTLVVGAVGEQSSSVGLNGDQADNSLVNAGAVYRFERSSEGWAQTHYIKASNTGSDDLFGPLAISGDGSTLVVGANHEASAATGINGDQSNDAAPHAGAAYVFE